VRFFRCKQKIVNQRCITNSTKCYCHSTFDRRGYTRRTFVNIISFRDTIIKHVGYICKSFSTRNFQTKKNNILRTSRKGWKSVEWYQNDWRHTGQFFQTKKNNILRTSRKGWKSVEWYQNDWRHTGQFYKSIFFSFEKRCWCFFITFTCS